jgi:hypothetical protein
VVLGGAAEGGQDGGIDAVGFFQLADRLGVRPGALGIDQRDADAGLDQFGGDLAVEAAGGFDDHQVDLQRSEVREELCDALGVVGQLKTLAGGIDVAVERGLGHVDADDEGKSGIAGRGLLRNGIVLHGGCPALRMRTASRGRVRPAVRVRYTRPPAIRLRDGVMNARTRSICRRPSFHRLLATLRSLRNDMLDWTRFVCFFEHTRHGGALVTFNRGFAGQLFHQCPWRLNSASVPPW